MDTTLLRAAYETYRAQIMLNGIDHEGKLRIDPAYYFAVSVRMFPYFHTHWCDDPDPFSEIYSIGQEFMDEVLTYVDDLRRQGHPIPSFYALEGKFGNNQKSALIQIFRYCYLSGRFDPDFYGSLLNLPEYPTGASAILEEISKHDCLLV
ncbi:MAG: hypothetical protein EA001_09025 [Oscillatoriales cyanobacterium]|nr:MAG: hypothetical protein EA001_09025 [Oscillatoriales cyanobacterium]